MMTNDDAHFGNNLFFKMFGDVWDMFWDHDWHLRNYLEPDRSLFLIGGPFQKDAQSQHE